MPCPYRNPTPQASRGDRIYLVRGKALDSGAQESVTSRRLLDAFADIAGDMRFRGPGCVKRPMEGALEAEAVHLCEVEKIHVVAVQVGAGCTGCWVGVGGWGVGDGGCG